MSKTRLLQRSNNTAAKSLDIELPKDPSHWAHNIQETSLSFLNDSYLDLLLIGGGAENGELCWVAGVSDGGEGLLFHGNWRFCCGDIFLEVENQSVVGFTSYDLCRWLRITSRNNNIVSVRFVSPAHLTRDLKKYLNTRFQRNSVDHELQHTIRLNVYRWTVPCTTRQMREGEMDGVDYRFLSVEEFQSLEERGGLLESGSYAGNLYGTPLPPKLVDGGSDDVSFTLSRPDSHPRVPLHLGGRAGKSNQDSFVVPVGRNGLTPVEHDAAAGGPKSPIHDEEEDDDVESFDDDVLPAGWERVDTYPEYGVFYVDHINKKTQFEHPNAKRPREIKKCWSRNDLKGEFITTCLNKGPNGLGFTIIGGNETNDLLQVKTLVPGGPAYLDGELRQGDVLVNVHNQEVLGSTHKEIIRLFQGIPIGTPVPITVCRGYPLTFDPDDPNNKVITTMAVQPPPSPNQSSNLGRSSLDDPSSPSKYFPSTPLAQSPQGGQDFVTSNDNKRVSPDLDVLPDGIHRIRLDLVRGPDGFRFTVSDLPGGHGGFGGQRVRSIIDRSRCGDLKEGDVIEKINNITVMKMSHSQVVEILKACPVGKETEFIVLRGVPLPARSSSLERSPRASLDRDASLHDKIVKPNWKSGHWQQSSPHQSVRPVAHQPFRNQGRSKTPGPVLMSSTPAEGSDDFYSPRQQNLSNLHSVSSSRVFPSEGNHKVSNRGAPAPYSVPSSDLKIFGDYFSQSSFVAESCPSSDRAVHSATAGITYSSSSSASATPVQGGFEGRVEADHQTFPVRLFRQVDGFGFKVSGGSEDGMQAVTIAHISPGGSAEADGRMQVGDEVVSIDTRPMLGASCKHVKEALLAAASVHGMVNIQLQRKTRKSFPVVSSDATSTDRSHSLRPAPPYPSSSTGDHWPPQKYDQLLEHSPSGSQSFREVRLIKSEHQSFGFTIISTSAKTGSRICSIVPDSPAHQSGELSVDDLLLAINGVDVGSMMHEDIVGLIRSSGNMVVLVVATLQPCDVSPLISYAAESSYPDNVSHTRNPFYFQKNAQHDEKLRLEAYPSLPSKRDVSSTKPESGIRADVSSRHLVVAPKQGSAKFHYIEIKRGQKGFGFTITGGWEYGEVPLSVLKIAEGGPAEIDGNLKVGDQIIEINGQNTSGMTHSDAIRIVQSHPANVSLLIKRQPRGE